MKGQHQQRFLIGFLLGQVSGRNSNRWKSKTAGNKLFWQTILHNILYQYYIKICFKREECPIHVTDPSLLGVQWSQDRLVLADRDLM